MEKKTKKVDNKEVEKFVPKFLKSQWYQSRKFMDKADYLTVTLKDDVLYSEEEVDKAIQAFIEGGIK